MGGYNYSMSVSTNKHSVWRPHLAASNFGTKICKVWEFSTPKSPVTSNNTEPCLDGPWIANWAVEL
jgi:hypothetical protein